jgi:riboflavin-specific deaminase-like protein
VRLQRLYPRPGEIETAELISRLDLGSLAPADRPYLVLNMVSTLDGKATLGGRTRGLGGDADRELFHHLRTQADAVMVGAGTARVERYGRAVKTDGLRLKREREGLAPDPLTVIVSGRLDLPADLPLLREPDSRVLIVTAAEHELAGVAAQVDYLRTGGDLPLMLAHLRAEHGVRSVLCEGGPTLNSSLLAAGAVDELFLSLSPLLLGGVQALTIVAGRELPEPSAAQLVWLHEHSGELFARLRVGPS